MAGLSISGLVSNMDTQTIVNQLMQIEANPQTLLKQKLSATQSQATAYRAINTRFDALRSAAEALTTDTAWSAVKSTTSSPTVTAVTAATGRPGSVTFTVDNVARAHSVVSQQKWTVTADQTAADADYGTSTLDLTVGGTTTTVTLDGDGDGTATLAEAAAAINAKDLGITATAVRVSPTEYRLQMTASKTGAASEFTAGGTFDVVTQGANAQITVGSGTGYTMTSATNTFTGLIDGTSITVTQPATDVTLTVSDDPEAIADKVGALVTSANGLLDAISSYTNPTSSSASLKGDRTLRQLSTKVLDVLAYAVGGQSASIVGLELTQNGRYSFDKEAFVAKLTAEPGLVRDMFTQTTTTAGPDGDLATLEDNVTSAVGVAAKLAELATSASNSTTGLLTTLAKSSDSKAADLQDRIEGWDMRLELRRTTLMRQFTAMETALGTLKNQSSWLSAQLSTLPTSSS